ncbi:MAG: metallophosphoesterase, partial [Lachnospiraceae bacterium]|nr:metallophosphoesterase [Lachnospiraceae bacterium]
MNYWAHRGFSRLYPENTLTAFRAACEYDIAGIEFDVQLSSDGELVVIHDETVDRTTDGTGEVRAKTLEELRTLKIIAGFGTENAGRFEQIPTMTEVLEVCAPYCRECGMMLDIELKTGNFEYPGIEEKALKAVRAFGLERCVVWSSFNPRSLERMRALDPGCRIAVISSDVESGLSAAEELNCTELHPNLSRLKHYTEAFRVPRRFTIRAWTSQKVEPLFPAPAAAGDGYSGREDGPQEISENELTGAGASALFTNNIDLYCGKRSFTASRLQILAETQRLRKDSSVRAEDGFLEACAGVDVTPEPIRVEKGDRLEPTEDGVPYSLFYYREEVPVGMILSRGARIESNWTTYTGEHDTEWRTEPFTFERDGYVRIAFRGGPRIAVKKGVNAAYLDTLIRFRRAGRPREVAAGEVCVREASRLDERLREQTAPDDLRLLLCTDSHYAAGGTWDQTAQNLINVNRRISLDGLIFLGDLTDGAQPHDETLRYAKHVLEDLEGLKLPLFMCIGDHDFNMLGPEKDHIDRKAAEKLYLGRGENLVIDFTALRVRLIFAELCLR